MKTEGMKKKGLKMKHRSIFAGLVLALFIALNIPLHAQQKNNSPVKAYQSAIFQRDAPIVINGRSKTTQGAVTVEFNGQVKKTGYHNRRFKVEFPAMKAGGPYTIKVKDAAGEHIADDIYVGDIWVCVGQSNMMFPMTKMQKMRHGNLLKMIIIRLCV